MESGSIGVGWMAVFAVSGSVVFMAHQLHKRLLSNFMKNFQLQFSGRSGKCEGKKRVRFVDEVMEEASSNKKGNLNMKHISSINLTKSDDDDDDDFHQLDMPNSMPLNRQLLYKGILQYKTLQTHHI